MKKGFMIVIAMALALCVGVGATLAYLFVDTDPVKNTFVYGDINIDLKETTGDTYKMIPDDTLPKDPTVTVKKDSEACWLFVKVVKSDNFDDFLTYNMAEGWLPLSGVDGVYYRQVDAVDRDTPFSVLEDDQVVVKKTVTKTMLNADDFQEPTLTITAYAVQRANVDSETDAWALVLTEGVPVNP